MITQLYAANINATNNNFQKKSNFQFTSKENYDHFVNNKQKLAFTGLINASDNIMYTCYKFTMLNLGKRVGKITKYDTPEIIAARIKLLESNTKIPKTTSIKLSERIAIRSNIENSIYGIGAEKKEKKAFITIGLPGCGKSSVIDNKFNKEHGALTIEKDLIRNKLPEYKNGNGLFEVQEEVMQIWNNLLKRAISNGDNISISTHGASYPYLFKLCNKFKKADYEIQLVLVDIPTEKAAKQAIKRFQETGKFIDPMYHVMLGNFPKNTFKLITTVNKNLFTRHAIYSNNVPKGTPPVLIKNFQK